MTRVTHNHPWYVKDKGWIAAAQLQPGDFLLNEKGVWRPVDRIEDLGETGEVFNLRVPGTHTYFVSNGHGEFAWVHNDSRSPGETAVDSPPTPAEQQPAPREEDDSWLSARLQKDAAKRDTLSFFPAVFLGAYNRAASALTGPVDYAKGLASGMWDFVKHPFRSMTDQVIDLHNSTPKQAGEMIGAAITDAAVTHGIVKGAGIVAKGPAGKALGKAAGKAGNAAKELPVAVSEGTVLPVEDNGATRPAGRNATTQVPDRAGTPLTGDGLAPQKTTWTPPKNWNGPGEGKGKWLGDRGNSGWLDDRPEVKRITKGEPIPFVEGRIIFDKWVKAEFDVSGVKGGRAFRNADTRLIYKAIFERERLGAPGEEFSSSKHRETVTQWLKNQPDGFGGTGLRPHHAGGEKIQYVPADLHKVQHTDVEAFVPPD